MSKEYLAIFDLDGTLYDTSDVNYCAYRDVLEPYGIILDRNFYVTKCNGRHYTEFLPEIMGDAGDIERVHIAKKKAYRENLDKARENIHLFNMVRGMSGKYNLAVVTTASRQNTQDILSFFGHENLFDFLVTQEDITRTKPDPQGFIMAMEHFGIDAACTVIFEDSDVGIEAARASGAAVFAVDRF